jgi:DNA-binding CsgD family transcriptional regulator/PAS domain-containing protein
MQPSAETVSSLLGLLYESAASPEHWPGFLRAVSQLTGSSTSYFVLVAPGQLPDFSLNYGFDPGWQSAYIEHFHAHDVLLKRFIAAKQVHGQWIGTGASVISDPEFQGTVFYNDFVRPQGQFHHCAVALGELDGQTDGGMGMQRSPRDAPFGQETVALLSLLAPHLRRALNTHRALSQARSQNAELRHTVEALGQGLISLGSRGQVIRMSPAAQSILDERDGIELERGFLRASAPGLQSRLAAVVAGAVATGSGQGGQYAVRCATAAAPEAGRGALWTPSAGGAMLIPRQPPRRPLQLAVTPFRSGNVLVDDRPAALAFLSDPEARPASRAEILRALYRLTPAECRLADLLAQGCDTASSAGQLAMTVETARFHIKSIFRKTGARRQSDLVRLILGLPGGWNGRA